MDTDSPSPPGSLAIPDQHLLYIPAREGPALTTHDHTRTSCSDAHAFASAAPTHHQQGHAHAHHFYTVSINNWRRDSQRGWSRSTEQRIQTKNPPKSHLLPGSSTHIWHLALPRTPHSHAHALGA